MSREPSIRAVIFDLDGVLVGTDELHFRAWKAVADREGIAFDRAFNERFRGVSRGECARLLLARGTREYSEGERDAIAAEKDRLFRASVERLTPGDAFEGARELLDALRARGVKTAVGSASRNARLILERIGLLGRVDEVVDGSMVGASKPDPEVFVEAARRMGVEPTACAVVEDAWAGAEAARRAGMRVIGIGVGELGRVEARAPRIGELSMESLLGE